jgi:hypothetical protein
MNGVLWAYFRATDLHALPAGVLLGDSHVVLKLAGTLPLYLISLMGLLFLPVGYCLWAQSNQGILAGAGAYERPMVCLTAGLLTYGGILTLSGPAAMPYAFMPGALIAVLAGVMVTSFSYRSQPSSRGRPLKHTAIFTLLVLGVMTVSYSLVLKHWSPWYALLTGLITHLACEAFLRVIGSSWPTRVKGFSVAGLLLLLSWVMLISSSSLLASMMRTAHLGAYEARSIPLNARETILAEDFLEQASGAAARSALTKRDGQSRLNDVCVLWHSSIGDYVMYPAQSCDLKAAQGTRFSFNNQLL